MRLSKLLYKNYPNISIAKNLRYKNKGDMRTGFSINPLGLKQQAQHSLRHSWRVRR